MKRINSKGQTLVETLLALGIFIGVAISVEKLFQRQFDLIRCQILAFEKTRARLYQKKELRVLPSWLKVKSSNIILDQGLEVKTKVFCGPDPHLRAEVRLWKLSNPNPDPLPHSHSFLPLPSP